MSQDRPIEVAVIGGGCASITTAFELTRPEHHGRYNVTVYQSGWRLGGKGASGRGAANRIEEHGLHLWLGFYENAFRLLRECYRELGRDPDKQRMAHWRDAFFADSFVGLADQTAEGDWKHWLAFFPPGKGVPGDPLDERNPFTIRGYLTRSTSLLIALLNSVRELEADQTADSLAASADSEWRPVPTSAELAARVSRLVQLGRFTTLAGLIEAVGVLEAVLSGLPGVSRDFAVKLCELIARGARERFETLIESSDELRRLWQIVDMLLACTAGIIRFGLANDPRGFDAIDDYDFREWLELNGASRGTLDSAFMRGIYDLVFSYEDGDRRKPRMAAGQALRGAVRMFFTYRGALFWKMRAGMGDVVFAPFYEVLKRRGVKFRFFHRLENVRLAAPEKLVEGEKPYVEALEFDVQARVEKGPAAYDPLIDVDGLPCWPSQPKWELLKNGEALRSGKRDFESHWDRRKVGTKTLRVVRDFDFVVLGVGIGAIPHVCGEILERDERWRAMIENTPTIATRAFQIWMNESMEELGWAERSVNLSGFVQPFDTWADMSHLIVEESWPEQPAAIAYFCSAMPSADLPPDGARESDPNAPQERVRKDAVRFLDESVSHLWPRATRRNGGFRWELLVDPASRSVQADESRVHLDPTRFATQYWRANVNPSDRYVPSFPGTLKYRISPLDNTYDNLTITGDWTACGHNAGCVEAAVIAGRLAAHALSSVPALEDIIGYDHP